MSTFLWNFSQINFTFSLSKNWVYLYHLFRLFYTLDSHYNPKNNYSFLYVESSFYHNLDTTHHFLMELFRYFSIKSSHLAKPLLPFVLFLLVQNIFLSTVKIRYFAIFLLSLIVLSQFQCSNILWVSNFKVSFLTSFIKYKFCSTVFNNSYIL